MGLSSFRGTLHPSTANIPVIVCTAATREVREEVREIEGYLQAKGVGLIPKPFNIDELLTEVKRRLTMHPRAAEAIMQTTEQGAERGTTQPGPESRCRGGRDDRDRPDRQSTKKGGGG
jgi:DNA-binding response OmpR family regulator